MSRETMQEVADRYEHLYKRIEIYGQFMNRFKIEQGLSPIDIATYEEYKRIADWLKELQHFKDLEEQGRLIELPCKVGDTVWACHKAYNGKIVFGEYKITSIVVDDNGIFFYVEREINKCSKDVSSYSIEDIGERIFLIKEEAEAKLAELKGTEE